MLIQKDTKLSLAEAKKKYRLRALLIQKDTKPKSPSLIATFCLRALLIQKDTKHYICATPIGGV